MLQVSKIGNKMFKPKLTIFMAIFTSIFITSCASVSKIEPGRFAISCHYLMSDESCASEVAEFCPNGYRVTSDDTSWTFFEGAKKKMFVVCKDKNTTQSKESGPLSKLKEQGYTLSKNGNDIFALKEGKSFKLTDSKYLCSEASVDLAAAEAKGYTTSSSEDEFFLEKGDRKILLSKDKKHICKKI